VGGRREWRVKVGGSAGTNRKIDENLAKKAENDKKTIKEGKVVIIKKAKDKPEATEGSAPIKVQKPKKIVEEKKYIPIPENRFKELPRAEAQKLRTENPTAYNEYSKARMQAKDEYEKAKEAYEKAMLEEMFKL